MELGQLLLEASNIMLIGMLSVGLFLGILVYLIPLLNRLVPDDAPISSAPPPSAPTSKMEHNELIAVISVAVQQYRTKHK